MSVCLYFEHLCAYVYIPGRSCSAQPRAACQPRVQTRRLRPCTPSSLHSKQRVNIIGLALRCWCGGVRTVIVCISYTRGVYPTQYTSRMGTVMMKQVEEADTRIIVE